MLHDYIEVKGGIHKKKFLVRGLKNEESGDKIWETLLIT